jgi:hypothetical protein
MRNRKREKLIPIVAIDLNKIDDLDPDQVTDADRFVYQTLLVRPQHKQFIKGFPTTEHCSQEDFSRLVGSNPSVISRLLGRHILTPAMPWRIWFLQFDAYHKGLGAGRRGSGY